MLQVLGYFSVKDFDTWIENWYAKYIKTHGSVSCGPRSWRATREYINRKKENAIFTPM